MKGVNDMMCSYSSIGTSFFINAAKEWDRRKCIDSFHNFERKVFLNSLIPQFTLSLLAVF